MALRGEVGSEGPGLGEVPRVREREVVRAGIAQASGGCRQSTGGPMHCRDLGVQTRGLHRILRPAVAKCRQPGSLNNRRLFGLTPGA